MNRLRFDYICLLAVFCFWGNAHSDFSPNIKIVEQSASGIIFEWSSSEIQMQVLRTDSDEYQIPECGNLPLLKIPGLPQIPFDVLTFENNNTSYKVTVLDSITRTENVGRICPAPTVTYDEKSALYKYSYDENEQLYLSDSPYPLTFIQTQMMDMRGRQFVRIQIHPLKYFPKSGRLTSLRYLRVQVRAIGAQLAEPQRDVYSGIDIKLNKLNQFTIGQRKISQQPISSLKSVSPSEQKIKIALVDQGIYAIEGMSLKNIGVDISSIDPKNIKIENKGNIVPVQLMGMDDSSFDNFDKILFWGDRLDEKDQYYNAYTDTNIYWLEWKANSGTRYRSAPKVSASQQVELIDERIHFEKDLDYYHGDSDIYIHDTFPTPGEGWIWDKTIDPGDTFTSLFDLPFLNTASDSATVTLRVRGETFDTQALAHHLRVLINKVTVFDAFFDDREELIPVFRIPVSLLKSNGNALDIQSINDTGASQSRFYFDWYEIEYEKRLKTSEGWIKFEQKQNDMAQKIFVSGFYTSDIYIWDIDNQQSYTPEMINKRWRADIHVESAGMTDGNRARFKINESSVFEGSRGFNIVTLNPSNGKILETRNFDTWASSAAADSLASFLQRSAMGTIVLAAVRDDGSSNLKETVIQEFEAIGSQSIRNLHYRDSWAFIGKKGSSTPRAEMLKTAGSGAAVAVSSVVFSDGDSHYTVEFNSSSTLKNFVVFETAGFKTPKIEVTTTTRDLMSGGADYIIVTHDNFLVQAQRLANYRTSKNGFRTFVVTVEEIYNAFNNGIADPTAIQRFLKTAFENWQAPKPQFVLFFGDATWDPKRNIVLSTKFDFVPSLGNPVSDVLFACFDGDEDILPEMSVGRLPVQTETEARAIVDKIIEYESTPSQAWKKNFLFISGGFTEYEKKLFHDQSKTLAAEFIQAPPTFGKALHISKQEEEEQEQRSLILDRINNGIVWANFIGHAGSRTWELMFNNPDIEELQNSGRYPFISSMTCHTGRFAEPNQDSFGEKFILIPNRGAIGFWGTSGWGYSYEDYQYLREIYPIVLQDTVRYLGDITRLAKYALWSKYGSSAHYKNLILQYNLISDPALGLSIPTVPDLVIDSQDLFVDPISPSESDSVAVINVNVENWGLATNDSVDIDISVENEISRNKISMNKKCAPIGLEDSVSIEWKLHNMAGPVNITAVVDPNNYILEYDESNNEMSRQISVLSSDIKLVSPLPHSIIPYNKVSLKIESPQKNFEQGLYYVFQLDTTSSFSSPALITSNPIIAHPLVTRWSPGYLEKDRAYYWRVKKSTDISNSYPIESIFFTSETDEYGWKQNSEKSAEKNSYDNAAWNNYGVTLSSKNINIVIQSSRDLYTGFAIISLNDMLAMNTARGHNVVVLDRRSGEIIQTAHFDTYGDKDAPANYASFLSSIAYGNFVLAAVSEEGGNNLTEQIYQALESIGSAQCRNIKYRDSWAIIGIKGATPGSVLEGLTQSGNGAVVLKDTLSFLYNKGKMQSEKIGPTLGWDKVSVDLVVPDSSDFFLDILGFEKNSLDSKNVLSSQMLSIDMTSVDAQSVPLISLLGNFFTFDGKSSPLLKSWQVTFKPPPDLAINHHVFSQSADTVVVGQDVNLYLDAYNIGQALSQNVKIRFEDSDPNGIRTVFAEKAYETIQIDSYIPIKVEWKNSRLPGLYTLYITLDPLNDINELSESNNSLASSIFVQPDTLHPSIDITFDGREIIDGDLVSAQPVVLAQIHDNSPFPQSDTTKVKLVLDGNQVTFKESNDLQLLSLASGDVKGVIVYKPKFLDGKHLLEISVSDAAQNIAHKSIEFVVESDLTIRNLLNYPNPFDRDTNFSFELSQPAFVSLKIYTVAGRLVHSIDNGWTSVGYHSIPWSGRDEQGDILANGVYIYTMSAQNDSEKFEKTSKVVIMR